LARPAHARACVDVDIWKESAEWDWSRLLGVLRAALEYSWLPREVVATRHGYHVYTSVPWSPETHWLRLYYGDDAIRWERDLRRVYHSRRIYANVCFENSEIGKSTIDSLIDDLPRVQ